MELLVVANPVSGGGRARRRAEGLAETLGARRHHVELLLTRHAGHARDRLARSRLPEVVVAVGGDGTINEIVNGLMSSTDPRRTSDVTLAVLPTGTANVLARELELPADLDRAVRLVERGVTRRLDVGHLRSTTGQHELDRYFVCMASAGLDGQVTRIVAGSRSGTQGFVAYAGPVSRALRSYRAPSLQLRIDDAAPIEGGWALISLVRNYGGLFALADGARPGAGRFEICVLRNAGVIDVARLMLAGLRGGAGSMRGMTVRRGTMVCVQSTDDGPPGVGTDVQVDGDWVGATPVECELVPAALRVAVAEPA